jgi:hypothetical protein
MRRFQILVVAPALLLGLGQAVGCVDRSVGLEDTDGDPDANDEDDEDMPLPDDYDPGVRPGGRGAMYSVCADSSVCTPLEFCVFPAGEAGFCSDACDHLEDASNCDAAPDGEARAFCLDIGLPDERRVCAIDCENGRPCPDGMRCEQVESGGRGRGVCF